MEASPCSSWSNSQGLISPATLHTPRTLPAEQRSAAGTRLVGKCGQALDSLCPQTQGAAQLHPSASVHQLLPARPASLALGGPLQVHPAPRGWARRTRRVSECPASGPTQARSPFLWGTTTQMKYTFRRESGVRGAPRGVCSRAGRASEGDNLRVTQYLAGKAGVPSRHLRLKFTLQSAGDTGGR